MAVPYKPVVTIVGGGMITQVQILPSIYQLQRIGAVGAISVTALDAGPLKVLAADETLARAFPGQSFAAYPDFRKVAPEARFPDLYKEVIAAMPPRNVAVVAVPDQLHYPVIKFALEHDQHVLTVKPLVLKYDQAVEIEKLAYSRGLFVGIEYHKRFDDRNLMARSAYRGGRFGEFRLGNARLVECWYYRHSNFQNWMTVRELRRLRLHRLPLHRSRRVRHRAPADRGQRLRHTREVSQRQGRLPVDGRADYLGERRVP